MFIPSDPIALRVAWLETAAITLILPGMGFWIDRSDPFFLDSQFSWLICAPLLISLRYGFLCGISSAIGFIGFLTLGKITEWRLIPVFPTEQVIGMLLVTMVAAEFRGKWERRHGSLETKYRYLKTRMEEFTRIYHLIKISHKQLEQRAAGQVKTLSDTLRQLEKKILTIKDSHGKHFDGIGDAILRLFIEHTCIQTAAIYSISDNREISYPAVACVGKPRIVSPSSCLLREALRTGNVVSIRPHHDRTFEDVLLVIPLVDIAQRIWGVVVVYEMPWFSLQEKSLDLLAILGGRIGDLVKRRTDVHQSTGLEEFEFGFRRILKEVHYSSTAAVVATIINSPHLRNELNLQIPNQMRGLDKAWTYEDTLGRQVTIFLLPMTDDIGVGEFLTRFGISKNAEDTKLGEREVFVQSWLLNRKDPSEKVLSQILQFCHIDPVKKDNDKYDAEQWYGEILDSA